MTSFAAPVFDEALIRRYDRAGPRYTSYPTAVDFSPAVGADQYLVGAAQKQPLDRPLSLYFHLPFCASACYYCGCTKIVTKHRDRSGPYVELLVKELELQAAAFGQTRRPVVQIHWGGGTPTFLQPEEMIRLVEATRKSFNIAGPDRLEQSIEVDPRFCGTEMLVLLQNLGFNRLSLGVQDFDPIVQEAVNRRQSVELVEETTCAARAHGFKSVSFDLIYGLPFQTEESFAETVRKVLALSPDRLSIFNYAHLPERFKTQRRISREDLPLPDKKLRILSGAIRQLLEAGYVHIGMDHFAKPEDELSLALANGTLQRNFQGYSTRGDADLIGIGMSSIGQLPSGYFQNTADLEDYKRRIEQGRLAISRGVLIDEDDRIRREIIASILCRSSIDVEAVERRHELRFTEYFHSELEQLEPMFADGLLGVGRSTLDLLPKGRLLARNVAMVFDARHQRRMSHAFSRVI